MNKFCNDIEDAWEGLSGPLYYLYCWLSVNRLDNCSKLSVPTAASIEKEEPLVGKVNQSVGTVRRCYCTPLWLTLWSWFKFQYWEGWFLPKSHMNSFCNTALAPRVWYLRHFYPCSVSHIWWTSTFDRSFSLSDPPILPNCLLHTSFVDCFLI